MRRVLPVVGEATCFYVESDSVQCTGPGACGKMQRKSPAYPPGGKCPACGVGKIVERWMRVDIASFFKNGQCSCEWFEHHHKPLVSRLSPAEQAMGRHRCKHIDAARQFALDMSLKAHEARRLAGARGESEEQT